MSVLAPHCVKAALKAFQGLTNYLNMCYRPGTETCFTEMSLRWVLTVSLFSR